MLNFSSGVIVGASLFGGVVLAESALAVCVPMNEKGLDSPTHGALPLQRVPSKAAYRVPMQADRSQRQAQTLVGAD